MYKSGIKLSKEKFSELFERNEDYINEKGDKLLSACPIEDISNENFELDDEIIELPNGMCVVLGYSGGDWQKPVGIAVYLSEDGFKIVTPLEGNSYNRKYMVPWGETSKLEYTLKLSEKELEYYTHEAEYSKDPDFISEFYDHFDNDRLQQWIVDNIPVIEDTRKIVSKENLVPGAVYEDECGRLSIFCGQVTTDKIVYGEDDDEDRCSIYNQDDLDEISLDRGNKSFLFLSINKELAYNIMLCACKYEIANKFAKYINKIFTDGRHYNFIDSFTERVTSYNIQSRSLMLNPFVVNEIGDLVTLADSALEKESHHRLAKCILLRAHDLISDCYVKDVSKHLGEEHNKVYLVNSSEFKSYMDVRTSYIDKSVMTDDWKDRIFGSFLKAREAEREINNKIQKAIDSKDFDLARELGAVVKVKSDTVFSWQGVDYLS